MDHQHLFGQMSDFFWDSRPVSLVRAFEMHERTNPRTHVNGDKRMCTREKEGIRRVMNEQNALSPSLHFHLRISKYVFFRNCFPWTASTASSPSLQMRAGRGMFDAD